MLLVFWNRSTVICEATHQFWAPAKEGRDNDVGYTSGLERHKETQGIQNTCDCCCTPATAGHRRMELDIAQEPEHQVDSLSVGVELEPFRLVGIQEEAGCYRWGFDHQAGLPGLEQHEHDPPRPCAVRLPPFYEPSIPF